MMQQVVEAKPDNAKAHYLYAEILAHNGKFEDATAQALQAKQIDPQIRFTSPEKFRHFEALLLNSSQGGSKAVVTQPQPQSAIRSPQSAIVNSTAPRPNEPERSGGLFGLGWGAILLIVVIVGALIMFARRRQQTNTMYQNAPAGGYGPQGGYGNGGTYGGGPTVVNTGGSGIGTGIAAGVGGFAAGMLAERVAKPPRQ